MIKAACDSFVSIVLYSLYWGKGSLRSLTLAQIGYLSWQSFTDLTGWSACVPKQCHKESECSLDPAYLVYPPWEEVCSTGSVVLIPCEITGSVVYLATLQEV